MEKLNLFLSLVLVVENKDAPLEGKLREVLGQAEKLVNNYEIILVDNCSAGTVDGGSPGSSSSRTEIFDKLVAQDGIPNLQVYALVHQNSFSSAAQIGLENALGDLVLVMDPFAEDIQFLPQMLERAMGKNDILFAVNETGAKRSFFYRIGAGGFNLIWRVLIGNKTKIQTPSFVLLSRRVVSFILNHPQPDLAYLSLSAMGGFRKEQLLYKTDKVLGQKKKLRHRFVQGINMLIFDSYRLMRITSMSAFLGACINLFYSVYVVAVWFTQSDVAPGWTTLSLQQSGMFFLIFFVLFVLSEYVLYIHRVLNKNYSTSVGSEFFSSKIKHHHQLNIDESNSK